MQITYELIVFTPIPSTFTSLPLDGPARNYHFVYIDMQDRAIYHVSINFLLPPDTRGEKKNHLVLAGIEPRSNCFTSNCSNI